MAVTLGSYGNERPPAVAGCGRRDRPWQAKWAVARLALPEAGLARKPYYGLLARMSPEAGLSLTQRSTIC